MIIIIISKVKKKIMNEWKRFGSIFKKKRKRKKGKGKKSEKVK